MLRKNLRCSNNVSREALVLISGEPDRRRHYHIRLNTKGENATPLCNIVTLLIDPDIISLFTQIPRTDQAAALKFQSPFESSEQTNFPLYIYIQD